MAVGVRGAPGHCCLSHVAPGATQTPQLALQQTCPVLQVLRPHIEIVFCEITATALCMASSQKVGAEPATPPVDAAPALSPVEAAAASAIVGAPALALAPARPATGPAGDCSFGNALGLVPELPEPLGCGRVSVSLDTGLPGVTTMPIGAACSGAISPTSPIAAGAFITNPRLRAKPTTLMASSTTPPIRLETTIRRRRLDQRRGGFELCSISTPTGPCTPRSSGSPRASCDLGREERAQWPVRSRCLHPGQQQGRR